MISSISKKLLHSISFVLVFIIPLQSQAGQGSSRVQLEYNYEEVDGDQEVEVALPAPVDPHVTLTSDIEAAAKSKDTEKMKEILNRIPQEEISIAYCAKNLESLLVGGKIYVYAKDTQNKWYVSQVLKKNADKILVHYLGWSDKNDQWLDATDQSWVYPITDIEQFLENFQSTENLKLIEKQISESIQKATEENSILPIIIKPYTFTKRTLTPRELHGLQDVLTAGADINARDPETRATALMLAARNGDLPAFQLLLIFQPDLFARSKDNSGVLDYAIEGKNQEIIQFIISKLTHFNGLAENYEGIFVIDNHSYIYAKDKLNKWYVAEITEVDRDLIKIHYLGWTNMHDEWIAKNSDRFQSIESLTKMKELLNHQVKERDREEVKNLLFKVEQIQKLTPPLNITV